MGLDLSSAAVRLPLSNGLDPNTRAKIGFGRAAVQGIGVGKTSLAIEYAHWLRSVCGRLLVSGQNAHRAVECS
jgi:hypothetical protein